MLAPTQRAGQSQVSGLRREGEEGAAGRSVAQVGSDEAFLGLRAGLRDEGPSNAGRSGPEKPMAWHRGGDRSVGHCPRPQGAGGLEEEQSLHHSFTGSAQSQSPPHHHLLQLANSCLSCWSSSGARGPSSATHFSFHIVTTCLPACLPACTYAWSPCSGRAPHRPGPGQGPGTSVIHRRTRLRAES